MDEFIEPSEAPIKLEQDIGRKNKDYHSHTANQTRRQSQKIERTAAREKLVSVRPLPELEGVGRRISEKDRNGLGEQQVT
jgi:hypothetical protein